MKTFLLVMPRVFEKENYAIEFSLGIMYISSVLKRAGHYVKGLNLGLTSGNVADVVAKHLPWIDVLGITCGAIDFNQTQAICLKAKEINPDIKIVIGGALPSSEPELILRECKADFVIIGEGEETIVDLSDNFDNPHLVKGIGFLNGGEYVQTEKRSPIANIDLLPYPDYDSFGITESHLSAHAMALYALYPHDNPKIMQVMSSRGCPHSCTFCGHTLPKKVRFRSIESMEQEIRYYIRQYSANMIYFCDEMLSHSKERILAVCDMMERLGLVWSAMFRVDMLDDYIVSRIKSSGCFLAVLGIESADETVLKSMKKQISQDQITNAIRLLRKYKIGIQGNLIFGDPAETWETAKNSLLWWAKNKFYFILLRFIFAFPGSDNYTYALRSKKLVDRVAFLRQYCPQINLSNMTDDEMIQLVRLAETLQIDNRSQSRLKFVQKTFLGYDITVECAECGEDFKYKDFRITDWAVFSKNYTRIYCRKCNQQTSFALEELHV